MFESWEEIFIKKVPPTLPVSCVEVKESSTRTVYRVFVGSRIVTESQLRDMAFKYALDDLRDGILTIQ